MNPFSQFEGGPAGAFINCLPSAFYTAVGLILIQQRAENAWIANLDTTQNISTSSSGGLFRSTTTTTLTTQTKPQWALITHPDLPIAGAVHTGYKLPNGNTVYSAANVVYQGTGYNLPNFSVQSYTHSKSVTSWTGFALAIFSAVAFVAASFVAPMLSASLGNAITSGLETIGGPVGLSPLETAGAIGFGSSLAVSNYRAGVSPFQGATGGPFYASGKSSINVNSLQTGGFDWRKNVMQTMILPNTLSTPGAIGTLELDPGLWTGIGRG